MIEFKFSFESNLGEVFKKIDNALGESALRATGYAAASAVRDDAINRAPVGETGVLKRNIIVKRAEEESDSNKKQTYLIVIRKGKQGTDGDAYYGYWVEGGHKIVGRKPKNLSWKKHRSMQETEFGTRTVAPRPFLRPAWDSLKGSLFEIMQKRMAEKIKEALD